MSKKEKLVDRFLGIPTDFSWDELASALSHFGFRDMSSGGGSYRTFIDEKARKIFLHKPHPGNIVKKYALREVRTKLVEYGLVAKEDCK